MKFHFTPRGCAEEIVSTILTVALMDFTLVAFMPIAPQLAAFYGNTFSGYAADIGMLLLVWASIWVGVPRIVRLIIALLVGGMRNVP